MRSIRASPPSAEVMSGTLLEVRHLTIAFPRAEPVRDLSFSVRRGETVSIVGESGSGKSLTALALMRLLPRSARIASGAIMFGEHDLARRGEIEMQKVRGREIAMIFQEPMTSLNPVLTVGAQIMEVLRLHEGLSRSAARVRAVELLERVRVADPHLRVDDYPHRLSGGMRQRVMIAIAIACGPKLLIADEPTTALDVTIQAQVLDLLDSLRRDFAMGLILITHDLGVVGQWADRVVVMYAGRKVEEGAPDRILANPRHPYTAGLLGASPRVAGGLNYRDGPLREIPGNIASAAVEQGCPFAPRCAHAIAACRLAPPPFVEVERGHGAACPVLNPLEAAVAGGR
jgi:peptide/nickel transport system ATP-binding protein